MISTALIPIAGQGTRMGPLAQAVPKAMFPLMDSAGRLRPVLYYICAEAVSAGAKAVGLIVSPWQQEIVQRYFAAARAAGEAGLPERVEYVVQPTPAGFGEAILRAADLVNGPFMILLGDHIHIADAGQPACGAQVAQAFAKTGGAAMVGMQAVDESELPRVGTARGEPVESDAGSRAGEKSPRISPIKNEFHEKKSVEDTRLYRCTDFVEKPSAQLARQRLVTAGLPAGQYLAHNGIYIFTPEILDILRELKPKVPPGKEVELAAAQSLLLERHRQDYYLYRVAGRAYDTGNPAAYAAAQAAMQDNNSRRGAEAQR